MKSNKKSIFKTMISVSGIVVLAKILGFIKQMVTANAFGATIQTDLISISEGLISNIDYLLVQTLATAFVPTYIHIKTNNPENSKKFVSNVIKVFLLVTTIIAILVTIAGPLISKILAPSYSNELTAELTSYVRIFAPAVIIIVELAIYNALLKANESFIPGELVGVNQSLILIALVLIIGKRFGPDTIVVAFYAYAVFNLIFLMVLSKKYWHIERGNPFKDADIRRMLTMMGPLILGYSVVFVNQQVDKIIVSGLGEGTITAMGYAAVLSNFINTFVGSICGVLFTYITKNVAEKNDKAAADLATQSMIQMGTVLLPISILTLMNAKDIVMIVFGRGKFDLTAVGNCSMALIGYSCMFVPYAIREIFSRFQYAYGDSKRPMMNSTIAIVFNIIFSIILSMWLGVLGVTLATSLSVLLCGLLNILTSRKRNSFLNLKPIIKNLPRWIIGIVICIIVSIIGQRALVEIHVLLRFIFISLLALILYCIVNYSTVKSLIKGIIHK
jgi:putative peptidoglycan lipid II flippase